MPGRKHVVAVLTLMLLGAALAATPAWAVGSPVKNSGVAPESFQPSRACGCHAKFIEQWSKSMHAQALTDPIYQAKLAEADKATDGAITPFCKKCHAPAAEMTGELASGATLSPGTAEGVNCSFCHQVSGMAKGEPGNTSQLVDPSGIRRAQLKDPQAPHPATYSELHEKAEICGGCHNVNHPINGLHLESTFSEWKNGPYAKEGIVCQDCHMSVKPGVIGPTTGQAAPGAPERDNIYQMLFVGGQVALGPSEIATARLKSAATIELTIPEVVAAGETATATVTITNVGAGHYLPTGLTEVRQMWLEVTATDESGTSTKIGERVFGTILADEKGNTPVELWDAASIKSDDRIPPREAVANDYEFVMPAGASQSAVKAVLLYKSVPDELAEKAGTANPTTEMAATVKTVFGSEEAKASAAQQPDEPVAEEDGSTPSRMWLVAILVGVVLAAGVAAVWLRVRTVKT